jgi:hypothetical protein
VKPVYVTGREYIIVNLMRKQGMWKDIEGIAEVEVKRVDLTLSTN